MTKRLKKTLEKTKFADAAVIPVAANPGGAEVSDLLCIWLTGFSLKGMYYGHVGKNNVHT